MALMMLFVVSCNEKPATDTGDALGLVPASASNVSSFNPKRLMDKADFEAVKSMQFFQDALKEAKMNEPALAAVMEDPEKSGIDLGKNAYLFTKIKPEGNMELIGGLVFSLADADAFADMLRSADIGGFEKSKSFSYVTPESGSIIAWDGEKGFIGSGADKNSIVTAVEEVFTGQNDGSIADNPGFQKAMKGDHDIVTYINFDSYTSMLPEAAKLQLGAMGLSDEDLVGNNVASYVDFKDGEVHSESFINLSKKVEKDLNMLFNDKVTTDFSPFVPNEGLTSFMTFAMDIKGTNQLLKEKGVGGMVNLAIARYGLTADDLANAFGGDIMLAAFANNDSNNPEMLFGTNIADSDVLDQFIQVGKDAGFLFAEDENIYTMRGTSGALGDAFRGMGAQPSVTSNDAQLLIKDGMVFISSRKDLIAKINEGGFPNNERIEASKYNSISKNIFGMHLDFSDLAKWSDQLELLQFDDLELKSNREKSEMRMRTNEPNENSLKSIFKMMNEAYKKDKLDIKVDDKDKKLS